MQEYLNDIKKDKQNQCKKKSDIQERIATNVIENVVKPIVHKNSPFKKDIFRTIFKDVPTNEIRALLPEVNVHTLKTYKYVKNSNASLFSMSQTPNVIRCKISYEQRELTVKFWLSDAASKPSPSKFVKEYPRCKNSEQKLVRYQTRTSNELYKEYTEYMKQNNEAHVSIAQFIVLRPKAIKTYYNYEGACEICEKGKKEKKSLALMTNKLEKKNESISFFEDKLKSHNDVEHKNDIIVNSILSNQQSVDSSEQAILINLLKEKEDLTNSIKENLEIINDVETHHTRQKHQQSHFSNQIQELRTSK